MQIVRAEVVAGTTFLDKRALSDEEISSEVATFLSGVASNRASSLGYAESRADDLGIAGFLHNELGGLSKADWRRLVNADFLHSQSFITAVRVCHLLGCQILLDGGKISLEAPGLSIELELGHR